MNIVLLRGLVREKKHWGSFTSDMEKAFPDANIITPEIPGVGEYAQTITPDNFIDMIKFMRKNIEHELTQGDNYIVAMSLGGMIARKWIELFPNDFKGASLVNTSFKGINPLFSRLRPLSVLNFVKIFLTPSVEAREMAIVKMVSNNSTNHSEIIKDWIEIQNKRPVMRESFINQIKAALTFSPPITWPEDIKLQILCGQKDRLCHHKSSIALHKKWGGELFIHPEAGHDLPIDDSEWMIEKLQKLIKE